MKKRTLVEALQTLQELDYVPGVSMVVPDFNYQPNKRKNFDTVDAGEDFPYDDGEGGGPQNSQGYGQQGVGRGGVGWGGRPDSSGGIRKPSATYQATWDTTDEGADWDETERHGGDRRNLWRDTPEAKILRKKISKDKEELPEAMGTPIKVGNWAPMDGPSMSSGRDAGPVEDEDGDPVSAQYMPTPVDPMRGPGNMWGGPGMIPGGTGGWATAPSHPTGDDPNDEEKPMKMREFFDPKPIEAEPLTNQGQDYLNDATDEEVENKVDQLWDRDDNDNFADSPGSVLQEPTGEDDEGQGEQSFAGRYGGETIMLMPNIGKGGEFIMSPDKHGAARGTYGMHMDGKDKGNADMLDKRSAWDVLQHVISAMAQGRQPQPEKPENEENTDFPG